MVEVAQVGEAVALLGDELRILWVTTIGEADNTPSEPGRDGFVPRALLQIDDVGVAGLPEPRFGG